MKASEEKKKKMREYAKTHRKQFNEYQRKYINKLKEEGKKPITTLDRYKLRIDKAIETINLMIYKGYTISNKGTARSYMATGENSEFGVRARELLDILKGGDKSDNWRR